MLPQYPSILVEIYQIAKSIFSSQPPTEPAATWLSGGAILAAALAIIAIGFYVKRIKKPPHKKIIFLGLPNSGKTVLFSVAMDYLQKKMNKASEKNYIAYGNYETARFINQAIATIRDKQRWPANTQGKEDHLVKILCNGKRNSLTYKDYGGEVFLDAFKGVEPSKNIIIDNGLKEELRNDIKDSDAIVLVVDSSLISNKQDEALFTSFFNLLSLIEESRFKGKLALTFSKGDVLHTGQDVSAAKKAFSRQQPNNWAKFLALKCKKEIFVVSAVEAVINEEGRQVPPSGFSQEKHSRNLLAPFVWIIPALEIGE